MLEMDHSLILKVGHLYDDRFLVDRFLGEGAFGQVFLVNDATLDDMPLALKVLHPQYNDQEEFRRRFKKEVIINRLVSSNRIIRIYDLHISSHNYLFVTMEYVPGGSLADIIKNNHRSLSFEEKLWLFRETLLSVQNLHDARLCHHDIKASNILVSKDGTLKLGDLSGGLNNVADKENSLHIGSMQYLAPEAWEGHNSGAMIDMYALGVLGYKIFTGIYPFRGESTVQLMCAHLEEAAIPPSVVDPTLPRDIDAIIIALMSKDPTYRTPSPKNVLEELEVFRNEANRVPRANYPELGEQSKAGVSLAKPLADFRNNNQQVSLPELPSTVTRMVVNDINQDSGDVLESKEFRVKNKRSVRKASHTSLGIQGVLALLISRNVGASLLAFLSAFVIYFLSISGLYILHLSCSFLFKLPYSALVQGFVSSLLFLVFTTAPLGMILAARARKGAIIVQQAFIPMLAYSALAYLIFFLVAMIQHQLSFLEFDRDVVGVTSMARFIRSAVFALATLDFHPEHVGKILSLNYLAYFVVFVPFIFGCVRIMRRGIIRSTSDGLSIDIVLSIFAMLSAIAGDRIKPNISVLFSPFDFPFHLGDRPVIFKGVSLGWLLATWGILTIILLIIKDNLELTRRTVSEKDQKKKTKSNTKKSER